MADDATKGNVSIWGAQFEARVSFDKAIENAKRFDTIITALEQRLRNLGGGAGPGGMGPGGAGPGPGIPGTPQGGGAVVVGDPSGYDGPSRPAGPIASAQINPPVYYAPGSRVSKTRNPAPDEIELANRLNAGYTLEMQPRFRGPGGRIASAEEALHPIEAATIGKMSEPRNPTAAPVYTNLADIPFVGGRMRDLEMRPDWDWGQYPHWGPKIRQPFVPGPPVGARAPQPYSMSNPRGTEIERRPYPLQLYGPGVMTRHDSFQSVFTGEYERNPRTRRLEPVYRLMPRYTFEGDRPVTPMGPTQGFGDIIRGSRRPALPPPPPEPIYDPQPTITFPANMAQPLFREPRYASMQEPDAPGQRQRSTIYGGLFGGFRESGAQTQPTLFSEAELAAAARGPFMAGTGFNFPTGPELMGGRNAILPSNARMVSGLMGMAGSGFGTIGQEVGRVGRLVSPHRLMGYASSIYLLDSLAGLVSGIGQRTIGESMRLQEYSTLLENTLISPEIGLTRQYAAAEAQQLINARYLAGFDISTAQLGLSRSELAEAYRGLAPVVRLTAQNPAQFQAGLQQGALISSLLLARDPTQGSRGVNVALSELYSGGPTRFRSLAERFELPRSRLYEAEAALGGEGANPGAVVLRVLEQMGFGPEYLMRRAQTLPGQLDRSGALFANVRADAFNRATSIVTDRLMQLNNAFEQFANSEAYDKTLGWFNAFFGGIFGLPMNALSQWFAGNVFGTQPGREMGSLAADVADRLQVQGGGFVNARGEMMGAIEAIRDATKAISEIDIRSLINQPAYSPGAQLRNNLVLGAAGTLGLGWLGNRLLGGALSAGLASAAGTLPAGAATAGMLAGAALPPALLAGLIAGGVGAGVGYIRTGNRIRQGFDVAEPGMLTSAGIEPWEQWAMQSSSGIGFALREFIDDWYNRTTGGRYGEQLYGERGATFGGQVAAAANRTNLMTMLRERYARTYDPSVDPGTVRAEMVGYLEQIQGEVRPDSPIYGLVNERRFVAETADELMSWYRTRGPRESANMALYTSLERARKFGQDFVMPDPATGQLQVFNNLTEERVDEIVARYATADPNALLQAVERGNEFLNTISENTAETAEGLSPYRYLNTQGLPGLIGGYRDSVDPRFVLPTPGRGTPTTLTGPAGGMTPTLARPDVRSYRLSPWNPFDRAPAGAVQVGRGDPAQVASETFGGVLTQEFGHKDSIFDTTPHRGMDVVFSDAEGRITAPLGGTLEYLQSEEDFKNSKYGHLWPSGFEHFGNTAVIETPDGVILSVHHMANKGFGTEGEIQAGAFLGYMGNTGKTFSGHSAPNAGVSPTGEPVDYRGGTTLFHGVDPATGNVYENIGAHGHIEARIPGEEPGQYNLIDPAYIGELAGLQGAMGQLRAAGQPITIQLGDNIMEIDPTRIEEMREELEDGAARKAREQMHEALNTLQRDGGLAELFRTEAARQQRRGGSVTPNPVG